MAYVPSEIDMSIYSDLYKDAYGVRPRHKVEFDSLESFLAAMDSLQQTACEEYTQEIQREERAYQDWVVALHKVARDAGVIVPKAFEWLMQAEGLSVKSAFDREHYAACNGFLQHHKRLDMIK